MWVKICANTNLDDAALAAELGADALGFVFAPSPRRVTPEQVAAITPHLPAKVEKIGVFYTLDPDEIISTVRIAGLTGAQLHGAYSPGLVAVLAAQIPGLRIIQTTHRDAGYAQSNEAAPESNLSELSSAAHVAAVLIDSRTATASGGTGIAFDWKAARKSLSTLGHMRLIVAGGLNPGNVREAISTLQPWGVDVASGVESHPGRKDPEKLAGFLNNARDPILG